jgi:hypothetical protein
MGLRKSSMASQPSGQRDSITDTGTSRPAHSATRNISGQQFIIVGLVISTVCIFYLATIRAGHPWGDDFAMYIQEAINISHHASYTYSTLIFDPLNPGYSPRAYPPGYPLMLVPIYATLGLNLTAMKVENILFFVASLVCCFFLFRSKLSFPYVVATIAVVGFNPRLWDIKDNILAEFPYTFFLYLFLFLVEKAYQTRPRTVSTGQYIQLIALSFACHTLRNTGFLLLPAVGCFELVKYKRLLRVSIVLSAGFLSLWTLMHFLSGSDEGGYLSMVRLGGVGPSLIWHHIHDYGWSLSTLWDTTEGKSAILLSFFAVFSAIALHGYVARIIYEPSVCDFYVPLHLGISLAWPFWGGFRYLIPIVPLYVFYGFVGMEKLGEGTTVGVRKYLPSVAVLLIAFIYMFLYSKMEFGPLSAGLGRKETQEFLNYVRNDTDRSAVIVAAKPRAISLYTGRQAAVYPIFGSDDEIWRYFALIHASYIVKSPTDEPSWTAFLARNTRSLEPTFSNDDLTVYRLVSGQH